MRKESRGLHYNLDYADKDDRNWLRDTIIERGHAAALGPTDVNI